MKYFGESDYRHGQARDAGVLLTNLGTPDEPTAPALRRYLKQFLWDPRVV
ncbi:ferrochelatase, partial [Thioalkalivibrio sp. ALE20]